VWRVVRVGAVLTFPSLFSPQAFDKGFMAKHGRLPSKMEKEEIRPLYEEYHAVKSQLDIIEAEGGPKAS